MPNLAANPGMHAYSDRAADLYETPPAAVLALLAAESIPNRIWEPAAGRGAIVEVLRAAGHDVVASDLRDHGDHRCPGIATAIDFYKTFAAPDGVDCLVTNPPFRESGPERFVSHGLKLCRRVIILARLTFMESKRPILESGKWGRVGIDLVEGVGEAYALNRLLSDVVNPDRCGDAGELQDRWQNVDHMVELPARVAG